MWQKIQGHDAVVERFRRAFQRGRLSGSFLFVGPPGVGKRRFAFALAMGLLCQKQENLDPCGICKSCKCFGHVGSTEMDFEKDHFLSPHPDLYYVFKTQDKSFLSLESLIGDKEHRRHAGLCYDISQTPFLGGRKVAIINDADFFNAEGANALLKILEEPPSDTVLILIGTSTAKQLPTIRSRCQIVRFPPLPPDTLSSLLVEQKLVSTPLQGKELAIQAEGSLDAARDLSDGDIDSLRTELTKSLSAAHWDAAAVAAKLNGLIESLGKDAPPKRRRLRLLFGLATDYFRDQMKTAESSRFAVRHLERTLDALEQVDRNANLPVVIEAWAVDLGGRG